MTVNELRIGNWLLGADGSYFMVDIYGLATICAHNVNCEPIPLTPEILGKCKIKPNDYFREGEGVYWFTGHNPEVPIQYVHQLQNLYFILKGQELQIDLT